MATMSGGSDRIRMRPSSTSTSLVNTRTLSRVRAFARAACVRLTCLLPTRFASRSSRIHCTMRSASSRSYQAASTPERAARRIRSRYPATASRTTRRRSAAE